MEEEKQQITIDLLVDDAAIIQVYEEVLSGKRRRFPHYTWELPNSLYYAKVIVRYLLEKKLQWDMETIKTSFNQQFLKTYKLNGMKRSLFPDLFQIIELVYPGKLRPWEISRTPNGIWDSKENQKEAMEWFIHEKLEWTLEEVKEKLTSRIFHENGFSSLLKSFDDSPYKAICSIYPQIHRWELKKVGDFYWDDCTKKEALEWLFFERMGGNLQKIKETLSTQTFIDNHLNGLLQKKFNGSPYEALCCIYGDQIHRWELNWVGKNFWTKKENIHQALHWLFNEKLGWDVDKIDESLTTDIIRENGFSGLVTHHFHSSPYLMAKEIYPDEPFEKLKKRSVDRKKKSLRM